MILSLAAGIVLPCSAGRAQVASEVLSGLSWRSIGPAVFGGRVDDVAGVAGDPYTIYIAHSSGGLFKTTNGGITWESVFNDGNTLSVGAVAIEPDNPNVVYVGTGEGTARNSASFGDGLYKSTDGGKTWKHVGLTNAERFSRIVVDPKDPRIVFAAAMGHEWGASSERGLYKSTDAGETWKRVLYVNDTTGAGDVAIDPQNPRILFAAMYDYLRRPWYFRSGGPGSGLYRSTDGGETWTKLTDPKLHNGLPGAEPIGRIGVAVAPSDPAVVYAVIEAKEPGILWRSSDHGDHWQVVNSDPNIDARPFYFSRVTVDSADPNRVYSVSRSLYISDDGGHSFREVSYNSMFGDNHVTWVDPKNPRRVLAGSDGGLWQSTDRGAHWEPFNNIPMSQPYHVSLDMDEPYNILAGFQDHEIWRGPNERWNTVGVRDGDWRRMRGHADGMNVVADPRDPNIIYYSGELGDLTRFDERTQEERYILPYPVDTGGAGANLQKYRFNWNSPLLMSPTNPDAIYFGGNVLFKTTNGGQSWQIVSPDLTTNDPEKLRLSGGPVNPDNSHAEYYCTIVSLAGSPRDGQLIWAGTDDGNLQLTRDGGAHWTNVIKNIPGAPSAARVDAIRTSFHDAGRAYVAIDQHRLDDFKPYAFMTTDYGKTWKNIARGLNGYVHVIVEDPREPALLYAGTELGIFVSFDRGDHWTDLRMGLPRLSVVDMEVHPRDNDLVIATHARGFYVLDDVTPLQQLAGAMRTGVTLFKPMPPVRYIPVQDMSSTGNRVFVARNKPYGALLSYYLPAGGRGPVEITISDSSNRTVQTLTGPAKAGINRVVWNLRMAACPGAPGGGGRGGRGGVQGPRVLPGVYTVRLQANGKTASQTVTVRNDPRVHAAPADLQASETLATRLTGMQCSVESALRQIGNINRQLENLPRQLPVAVRPLANTLSEEINAVRVELSPDLRDPEHLNLRTKISALNTQIQAYSGRPTDPQVEWAGIFGDQLQPLLRKLSDALSAELVKLNEQLRTANLPAIRQ